jgi:predicted RNA binding protein YcfA (HicA-like mRNA interferase family)
MSKLPVVKPKEVIKVLKKLSFVKKRSSGSHQLFSNEEGLRVTVAFHNKDIKPKTLESILKQAKLSIEKFNELR